ncbi:MAG: tRNA 2-thiocytidine biosynthesis protein TtcA [Salinivirgaceae bacterium]|nr:tRNA 2-thiocytidine biosynthesis protein TtcA [Salinivirgaceae bacterium]
MNDKEQKLFLTNTRKRVGKAVQKYELIKPDDTILVAVSGGKDSLFLLEALAFLKKHIPFHFNLKAVHIEVIDAPHEIDKIFLEYLCKKLSVPLHYRSMELGDLSESKKSPCFICSWKRRRILFEAIEELNCNKLALGHHMDDAIETLLLNMTYHGNISSMAPELEMFKGKFSIIRPLLLTEESNIVKYATIRRFPDELTLCEFEEKGNRFAMKKVVSSLSDLNKTARINLYRSMGKIDLDYLPK